MQPRTQTPDAILRLADCQDGALTLEQVTAHGVSPTVAKRLCAQRQWQRLGRGLLYLERGGPRWRTGAWAGVLAAADRARLGPEASGHP